MKTTKERLARLGPNWALWLARISVGSILLGLLITFGYMFGKGFDQLHMVLMVPFLYVSAFVSPICIAGSLYWLAVDRGSDIADKVVVTLSVVVSVSVLALL